MDLIILLFTVVVQNKREIFIVKSMFILYLSYYSLLILLNIALYIEYTLELEGKDSGIFVDIQGIVLYLLMGTMGLMIVMDLIPF